MNLHVQYARIVTPVFTYVKHSLSSDDTSAVARVTNPRTHEQFAELTNVTVSERGPGYYRIEGTNSDGAPVIWTADSQGCGCRVQIKITDTDAADVPT